jgi:hypothetical protein
MSVALVEYMLAATLIPLMFIVGLLVLFLLGAWPVGVFPSIVIIALLASVAIGLVRMARPNRAEATK